MKELSIEDWKDEYLKLVIYASEVSRENAHLRSELESVGTAAYLYGRSDLKAENAKLRELVRRMARALRVGSEWCDRDCEQEFDCNWMDKCPVESAMKELGVEVK